MIHIYLNAKKIVLNEMLTLQEVLKRNGFVTGNFAVAINRKFIPRGQYNETEVKDGDLIDVVTPMQGG